VTSLIKGICTLATLVFIYRSVLWPSGLWAQEKCHKSVHSRLNSSQYSKDINSEFLDDIMADLLHELSNDVSWNFYVKITQFPTVRYLLQP